jgi:hypothetical protein
VTNEQLLRDLAQKLQALARATVAERRRIAALLKAPGGEKLAAELKKYAGVEPLLAALDGLGRRPDPSTETAFDRIRREAGQRQEAERPDAAELHRRLSPR